MRIYGKKPPSPSDRPTEDEGLWKFSRKITLLQAQLNL